MALSWYRAAPGGGIVRLRLPRSDIEIRAGHAGRVKSVWVRDLDERTAAQALLSEP